MGLIEKNDIQFYAWTIRTESSTLQMQLKGQALQQEDGMFSPTVHLNDITYMNVEN